MKDTMKDMLAVVRSHQDQDFEHAKKWWREHSENSKAAVWLLLNDDAALLRDLEDDAALDLVTRFAIIGFREVALRAEGQGDTNDD
jgi:hypothetical protein